MPEREYIPPTFDDLAHIEKGGGGPTLDRAIRDLQDRVEALTDWLESAIWPSVAAETDRRAITVYLRGDEVRELAALLGKEQG